jgi:glutathione-specific gamma-glutamylcyclotransferase
MNDSATAPLAIAPLPSTEQFGPERGAQDTSILDHCEDPTATQDAFVHLPHLRRRLTPPDTSAVRITREVLAIYDERARRAGYPPNWRYSDQQIEESWRSFFASRANPGDLWVFGYGSLMWDPGFHFAEVRLADVGGYQRRFALKIEIARGSPGRPALMLSLERRPGRCSGLAFRIASELSDAESQILWRREMIGGAYSPIFVSMTTPQGSITGLAFASNPSHPRYVGELPLGETAAIIASGTGVIGTNRAYLEEMVSQLRALEIEDPYVERLLNKVNSIAAA